MRSQNKPVNRFQNNPINQSDISSARQELAKRLKELRNSLGVSLDDMAALCGVSRSSQIAYENASRAADSDYWQTLHKVFGINLQAVLTGMTEYNGDSARPGESALLIRYRDLPTSIRKTVDDVLLLAWLAYQDRKKAV